MTFETLGSIGDGLQIPLMMFVLSDVINTYGCPIGALSFDTLNKVTKVNMLLSSTIANPVNIMESDQGEKMF